MLTMYVEQEDGSITAKPVNLTFLHKQHQLSEVIVLDIETSGLNPYDMSTYIIGLSYFFPHSGVNVYISSHQPAQDITVYPEFKHLVFYWNTFVKHGGKYLNWNTKFDMHWLHRRAGFNLPQVGCLIDVALHYRELMSHAPNFKLKDVARRLLGKDATEGEDQLKEEAKKLGLNPKSQMYLMPVYSVAKYALQDTVLVWQIHQLVEAGVDKWQVREVCELRDKALSVLLHMELNGWYVDEGRLDQLLERFDPDEGKAFIAKKVYEYLPNSEWRLMPFNCQSPKQVKDAFKQLGYDLSKTDFETLDSVDHPLAGMILNYRTLAKAHGTYYKPYKDLITTNVDRKIHPTYFMYTATGRYSCANPNLQNVPRSGKNLETDLQPVKWVFTAPQGYKLVQVDFSQLELRLASHYVEQSLMLRLFNEGVDVHQVTADELSKALGQTISRNLAKTANFGFLYGAGYGRAMGILGIDDFDLTKSILDSWNNLYPEFSAYRNHLMHRIQVYSTNDVILKEDNTVDLEASTKYVADKGRYVRLPFGRVRRFDNISHHDKDAFNTLVQGTGAYLMERSLVSMYENNPYSLDEFQLIGTIHDSALAYVKEPLVHDVARYMMSHMQYDHLACPIRSDAEAGDDWYTLKKLEL